MTFRSLAGKTAKSHAENAISDRMKSAIFAEQVT